MEILKAEGLKKYYGKGENLVKALDGVELAIEEGTMTAIVGTSGSGKSTLINSTLHPALAKEKQHAGSAFRRPAAESCHCPGSGHKACYCPCRRAYGQPGFQNQSGCSQSAESNGSEIQPDHCYDDPQRRNCSDGGWNHSHRGREDPKAG